MSALDDIAWYNTLLQTGGKTYDRVVFDELVEAEPADPKEGNVSKGFTVCSDRMDELEHRINELEQRISDVNEAALYDFKKLEERIDALERRIEAMEWLTTIVKMHSKFFDAILRKLNHKGGNE